MAICCLIQQCPEVLSLDLFCLGLRLVTAVVNNELTNPHAVWTHKFNKTDFPTLDQFSYIRTQEVGRFNITYLHLLYYY